MRRTLIRAALALGCAVTVSAGGTRAGADPPQAERSFPITEHWSVERLLSLNKAEVVALWKTLDPPAFTELDGHYMGLIPNAGAPATQKSTRDFMYNQESTRGYWLGKAYKPTSATKGEGYNRWRFPGGKVVLNLRFGTALATSLIDGKPSYMMYYGAYNKNSTLIDELRKLDDYIYIGMGTTDLGNGKRSEPGHFVLVGPTDNWVGVDHVSMKK